MYILMFPKTDSVTDTFQVLLPRTVHDSVIDSTKKEGFSNTWPSSWLRYEHYKKAIKKEVHRARFCFFKIIKEIRDFAACARKQHYLNTCF